MIVFAVFLILGFNFSFVYNQSFDYKANRCVNDSLIQYINKDKSYLVLYEELEKADYFPPQTQLDHIKLKLSTLNIKDYACTEDTFILLKNFEAYIINLKHEIEGKLNSKEQYIYVDSNKASSTTQSKTTKLAAPIRSNVTKNSFVSLKFPLDRKNSIGSNIESEEDDIIKNIKEDPLIEGHIYNCTHPSYYQNSQLKYVGEKAELLLRIYSRPEHRACKIGCVEKIGEWLMNEKHITMQLLQLIGNRICVNKT